MSLEEKLRGLARAREIESPQDWTEKRFYAYLKEAAALALEDAAAAVDRKTQETAEINISVYGDNAEEPWPVIAVREVETLDALTKQFREQAAALRSK